jgi:uncharacterized protein YyaL (SSP411 family)
MHALALSMLLAQAPGLPADAQALDRQLAAQVEAAYDSARGGFVTKSKTPVEAAIELALLNGRDAAWLLRAQRTLAWTHGLMDTLTGGYINGGSVHDEDVMTADKRADSNGRRLELLVQAWQVTGNDTYRQDAARTVDWAERVLLDGRGGFWSAQIGDRDLDGAANGPILHAWLVFAAATHDARRKRFALQSLDRVWEECWKQPLGLVRRNSMGDIDEEPQLMDQVEMGRAYLLAARLCGRPEDAERARLIGEVMLARFQDAKGGFRTQSMPNKTGSIKRARSVSSENARAVRFLNELTAATGDARYRAAAGRATEAFAKDIAKAELDAAEWALAVRAAHHADLPGRADFVAEAEEKTESSRPRVTRFKNVRR